MAIKSPNTISQRIARYALAPALAAAALAGCGGGQETVSADSRPTTTVEYFSPETTQAPSDEVEGQSITTQIDVDTHFAENNYTPQEKQTLLESYFSSPGAQEGATLTTLDALALVHDKETDSSFLSEIAVISYHVGKLGDEEYISYSNTFNNPDHDSVAFGVLDSESNLHLLDSDLIGNNSPDSARLAIDTIFVTYDGVVNPSLYHAGNTSLSPIEPVPNDFDPETLIAQMIKNGFPERFSVENLGRIVRDIPVVHA